MRALFALAVLAVPLVAAGVSTTTYTRVGVPVSISTAAIPTSYDFASGTCDAESLPPFFGDFVLQCGTDRDDDRLVTDLDVRCPGGGALGSCSTDPDGFDDDFADGASVAGKVSLSVCFRRDNQEGGGDWDDVQALILPGNGAPPTDLVKVTLTLTEANSCPFPGNVSSHTHGGYDP
jgi:hypothetical protein